VASGRYRPPVSGHAGRAATAPGTRLRAAGGTAFAAGAAVGVLGGMIGLGGAEFRLPLLIALFGFAALQAVIVNKALSLIVVLTGLPARLVAVPWSTLAPHWTVAVNLLAGSLVGAWPARPGPPGCARPRHTASWRCSWCSSRPR
jgi:uncharacterized protein